MRTSLKCLVFYLIIGVILLNLYFLGQLYFQHQTTQETEQQQQQQHQHEDHHHHQPNPNDIFREISHGEGRVDKPNDNTFNLKNSNEFLVLDWTGHQHIFREQDPIKCKYLLFVKH